MGFNYNKRVEALYNLLKAPHNQPTRPLREVKIELIKKFLNVHNTTNAVELLMPFATLSENKQNLTKDSKQKLLLIKSIMNARNINTLNTIGSNITNSKIKNIIEKRKYKLRNPN